MDINYRAKEVEKLAQNYWINSQAFKADENNPGDKFYCLSMFPYPSGNIHMGHVRNYSIGDAITRYQKMLGKNVLQPMGWDAFGLPAENAAIKNKTHPSEWTYTNMANMKKQLQSMGYGYDWDREIATCTPEYYKWEQWLFIQLFKKGLAYKKLSVVNWDPVDNTVLANEQVTNGRGWRSGALIEKKEISQWFLKITDYADELLSNLDRMPGWPEQVKTMQKNWIGKSYGARIKFKFADANALEFQNIEVFTTRPDTLYGCTYIALAPEHEISKKLAVTNNEFKKFIDDCMRISTSEASFATAEKKGIDTGLKVVHPLTGELIPIWIASYILANHGTGAIMAVPAHDERDYEFSKKYNLPIKQVITSIDNGSENSNVFPFCEKGILINSSRFDNLTSDVANEAIIDALRAKEAGNKEINYRLRDWGISRQRYWGAPIPIIYCVDCGTVPVPEADLPVVLPEYIDFTDQTNILKSIPEFYNVKCPKCNADAVRETDTFDTFVESSWYYARFASKDQNHAMLDQRADYWTPVDLYIGGIEHAIMHLLYTRFIHKVMRDLGLVSSDEPCKKLFTQGMVLKDGSKMSKSKGNVVDPQEYIDRYGSDALRLFVMFSAPPEQDLEWSDVGVEAAERFIKRLWGIVYKHVEGGTTDKLVLPENLTSEQKDLRRKLHETLEKVTLNMEKRFAFNTVIAAIMELLNDYSKFSINTESDRVLSQEVLNMVVLMLSPIIPHVTHSLWYALGHQNALVNQAWPVVCKQALIRDSIEMVIQINGKLRGNLNVAIDADHESIQKLVLSLESIQKFLQDKTIKKIIIVPMKVINIVV